MVVAVTVEAQMLKGAFELLEQSDRKNLESLSFRWNVLEAASARLGGFSLDWYYELRGIKSAPSKEADAIAAQLVTLLSALSVHPTLALAALAQPTLDLTDRRRTGSFYTDFRLAHFVASAIPKSRNWRKLIVDPACGAGMLLAASVVKLAGKDRSVAARLIENVVCGCDLSGHGLRAASLVLASLTSDRRAIRALQKRLVQQDSLFASEHAWKNIAPDGIRAIVMNPPWERIRATRHEFLLAQGVSRHYGHAYSQSNHDDDLAAHKGSVIEYAGALADRFPILAGREIDFYEAFLALSYDVLSRDGGSLVSIVPCGLLRSQGPINIRSALFETAKKLEVSIFDNRARYFGIDTRFKFIVLKGVFSRVGRTDPICLSVPVSSSMGVEIANRTRIGRPALKQIRPDLTLPEVRSSAEWNLFQQLSKRAPQFGQVKYWAHRFCREVDMTNDFPHFLRTPTQDCLPLIEGRMVHQFTDIAKDYVSGTGRKAIWQPHRGARTHKPQFWFPKSALKPFVAERVKKFRVGFCDISGQTNERSMLATIVSPGVVCGNKVPTLEFAAEAGLSAIAFIGVANSFVFDWLLRRVMTTTVNYFILDSIPFSLKSPNTPIATRIGQLAQRISANLFGDAWPLADLRAELDVLVARSYGVRPAEMALMFMDFPLLDRSEPPIPGEERSTITRDFVLSRVYEAFGNMAAVRELGDRVRAAREVGAVPYRASHLFKFEDEMLELKRA